MEFTLHYQGPLKAATGKDKRKDHKHDIRKHFHRQLKRLWILPQLEEYKDNYERPEDRRSFDVVRRVGEFGFVPLVTSSLGLTTSLHIIMLRPEPTGRIFSHGGDIDNRLKTLLDALKVPSDEQGMPSGIQPAEDEQPFLCLVEDDSLVTDIEIKTAHWLEPQAQNTSEVVLVLRVQTRGSGNWITSLAFP